MNKTFFTCIAIVGLAAPAAAQNAGTVDTRAIRQAIETARQHMSAAYVTRDQRGTETQTEKLSKTVKIGADGELALTNIAGDITVTKGSGTTATVEIVKTARAQTQDEAKQMLGLVQVEVTERNGRAEVVTRYPRQEGEMRRHTRSNVNVSVDYTVTAPAGARLTIRSISGDVTVTDIKGEVTVNVISGDITLTNAGRIGGAKTISGDVQITDAQVDNGLDVESVSGDVVLKRVRAARIGVGSVSGDVMMRDVQCDRAEAHSISGNVQFDSPLAKSGRYEFKSHSGDVRIGVAGGAGFELAANSFSGSVRNDIAMKLEGGERNAYGPGRGTVHGVYGDGGAVLTITTFSGSIVIAKQ